jgi:hypothetical protein
MMKRISSIAVLTFVATALQAQQPDPQCAPGNNVTSVQYITSDACQKAVDLFKYMTPQLGVSLTGGNALLGTGGTVGGLGHARFEVRVNGLWGSVPNVQNVQPQAGPYRSSSYTTKTQILGLPAATAEIGIFKGLTLPLTRVGGIDALVTATYIPDVTSNGVSVRSSGGNLKWGIGARIGLLEESLLVPGVSVTYLRRDLPKINIVGTVPTGSGTTTTLQVNNLEEKTTAWRLVASKSLIVAKLAAGIGQDRYESNADVSASVNFSGLSGQRAPFSIPQNITRTSYFADASMNLLLIKLIGEIGMVSGGTVTTYNKFDKRADNSRLYGSLGVTLDFPPF